MKPLPFIRHFLGQLACLLVVCLPGLPLALADSPAPAKSITVVVPDDFPPLLFRDANGELQGSVKEIWDLWAARTGIKVKLGKLCITKRHAV
jgi:ABC-type amino acid transport substrate-binding protein